MNTSIECFLTNNYYELLKIAKKITRNHEMSGDLLHEVICQLYDKEKISLMEYTDNQIKYYIVAIMRINWNSSTSPFHYKIRRESHKYVEINMDPVQDEEQDAFEQEIIFTCIEQSWTELDWFRKSLFEWYMGLGSLKKVAIKTSIPLASVGKYIKEAKEIMREDIKLKLKQSE